ncbi:unnamed protein product [Amoebophrya sp. A25]|nr:unnamed protein product [Amoebophrya sp. A25]|eukprot:GSA25T00009418001.1
MRYSRNEQYGIRAYARMAQKRRSQYSDKNFAVHTATAFSSPSPVEPTSHPQEQVGEVFDSYNPNPWGLPPWGGFEISGGNFRKTDGDKALDLLEDINITLKLYIEHRCSENAILK